MDEKNVQALDMDASNLGFDLRLELPDLDMQPPLSLDQDNQSNTENVSTQGQADIHDVMIGNTGEFQPICSTLDQLGSNWQRSLPESSPMLWAQDNNDESEIPPIFEELSNRVPSGSIKDVQEGGQYIVIGQAFSH